MRAILDTNVLVSAILTPTGPPGRLIGSWIIGEFEFILSPRLLAELQRALSYEKIRRMLSARDAVAYVSWLAALGTMRDDPTDGPAVRAPDPDDDYLVALAAGADAYLVSGDRGLLSLSRRMPVVSVRRFREILREQPQTQ